MLLRFANLCAEESICEAMALKLHSGAGAAERRMHRSKSGWTELVVGWMIREQCLFLTVGLGRRFEVKVAAPIPVGSPISVKDTCQLLSLGEM
jgi:hypothetical protein